MTVLIRQPPGARNGDSTVGIPKHRRDYAIVGRSLHRSVDMLRRAKEVNDGVNVMDLQIEDYAAEMLIVKYQ